MSNPQSSRWGAPPEVEAEGFADSTYRPLSMSAVASLVFAALSVLIVFDWSFGVVPLTGIVLGLWSLWRIRQRSDELIGGSVARTGVVLSMLIWGLGYSWLCYVRAEEIPAGYTVVTYTDLQPDPDVPGEKIPARAKELVGKKIFVAGFIYPGRQMYGLKQFLMSRDNGTCKFCIPDPLPTDLIDVRLAADMRTAFTRRMIHVGGVLSLTSEDEAAGQGGVAYKLEADYLR